MDYVYDYEFCCSMEELRRVFNLINRYGYKLIAVIQGGVEDYTVFFQRPANG